MLKIEEISNIGIGTYRMGYNSKENIDSILYGIEKGINLIDTASNYLNGESEKIFSKIKFERDLLFIVSKAGYVTKSISEGFKFNVDNTTYDSKNMPFHSISADYIKYQLINSLKKCNVNTIDCYLIHNPEHSIKDKTKSQKIAALEMAFGVLEEAVSEGKIRYYGISSNKLYDSSFLDVKDYLHLKNQFSNFLFLQFPYNLIEKDFYLNNEKNLIKEYKDNGFYLLSNRPLNTMLDDKYLRLAFYDTNYSDKVLIEENELFNEFINSIQIHLHSLDINHNVEDFYPLDFLIKNRLKFGNKESMDNYFFKYLLPFLGEIEFKLSNTQQIEFLFFYWDKIYKNSNNVRLDLLLRQNNLKTNNLPKYLIDEYNSKGIDTVLMGLTQKKYIDNVL